MCTFCTYDLQHWKCTYALISYVWLANSATAPRNDSMQNVEQWQLRDHTARTFSKWSSEVSAQPLLEMPVWIKSEKKMHESNQNKMCNHENILQVISKEEGIQLVPLYQLLSLSSSKFLRLLRLSDICELQLDGNAHLLPLPLYSYWLCSSPDISKPTHLWNISTVTCGWGGTAVFSQTSKLNRLVKIRNNHSATERWHCVAQHSSETVTALLSSVPEKQAVARRELPAASFMQALS